MYFIILFSICCHFRVSWLVTTVIKLLYYIFPSVTFCPLYRGPLHDAHGLI